MKILLFSLCGLLGAAASVRAQITVWTFDSLNLSSGLTNYTSLFSVPADVGSGTASGMHATSDVYTTPAGKVLRNQSAPRNGPWATFGNSRPARLDTQASRFPGTKRAAARDRAKAFWSTARTELHLRPLAATTPSWSMAPPTRRGVEPLAVLSIPLLTTSVPFQS